MNDPNPYDGNEVTRPKDFNKTAVERTQIQARKDFSTPEDEGYVYVQDDRADDSDRPVEVAIVGPLPEPQITDWSSQRVYVQTARQVQLVGARRNRVRALLWLDSGETDTVTLLRGATDSPEGAAILSGATWALEVKHNEEIWAIANGGDVYVNVFQEYIVEGTDRPQTVR